MCCPAELISTRVLSVNVFHHTTVLDRSFVVSRSLCSQADARSSGENTDVEYGFLESDVLEENNAEEKDGEEVAQNQDFWMMIYRTLRKVWVVKILTRKRI